MSNPSTAPDSAVIHIPEWEHNTTSRNEIGKSANNTTSAGHRTNLRSKLDIWMPPQRRYIGLRRRTFMIIALCVIIALLALIIGLAVGLTKRSST